MLSDDSLAKALYDEFGMNLTPTNPERYWRFAADGIRSRWLTEHDAVMEAAVAAMAWDEGAGSRQCHCAAFSEGECACGNYPSETNPYRAALGVPAGSEQEAEHG